MAKPICRHCNRRHGANWDCVEDARQMLQRVKLACIAFALPWVPVIIWWLSNLGTTVER